MESERVMKIVVDRDRCVGTGMCESIAPDVFEVADDGTLVVHRETVTRQESSSIRQAVASCPAVALALRRSDAAPT